MTFQRFLLVPLVFMAGALWAADPDGAALYKAHCASCHENGSVQARIPKRDELASRTPENVFNAMDNGAMQIQAAGLSADEERAIARFLTGKEFSAPVETALAGTCPGPAKKLALSAGDWNGWGVELDNSRFQPKPGLSAADIPKLKLKWAFGFNGDTRAFAQPTVAGGRIFVGSAGGTVYSLDAATGCTYWAYKARAGVRTAVQLAKSKSGRYIAYFGDIKAFAHAVDAETGALVWKTKVEEHPAARVTGAPVFYDGRLFVPVASLEEGSGRAPNYECCTFRGSMVALDADTGKQIWKSFTVLDPPKATRKSKVGTQLYGPAGAAIWSAPTIDTKRKLVYAATGDSYTDQDINTSDAVVAYDLNTGSLVWVSQATPKDNFIVGCPASPNCPEELGPDFDFGSAPILRNVGGKQIIIAGQKSGVVYGLDPDQRGKVIWQTKLGAGSALGGVEWGHAADEQKTYVAISDINVRKDPKPGISALNLKTGETVWSTPAPKVECTGTVGCQPAQSAAVSVIPGAVFSGSINGHFRAYSTKDGSILWDFDTAKPFDTVNKVQAKGGSINGAGPTIANGMVFTNSGYSGFGGAGGNVLLAFSVDGK